MGLHWVNVYNILVCCNIGYPMTIFCVSLVQQRVQHKISLLSANLNDCSYKQFKICKCETKLNQKHYVLYDQHFQEVWITIFFTLFMKPTDHTQKRLERCFVLFVVPNSVCKDVFLHNFSSTQKTVQVSAFTECVNQTLLLLMHSEYE